MFGELVKWEYRLHRQPKQREIQILNRTVSFSLLLIIIFLSLHSTILSTEAKQMAVIQEQRMTMVDSPLKVLSLLDFSVLVHIFVYLCNGFFCLSLQSNRGKRPQKVEKLFRKKLSSLYQKTETHVRAYCASYLTVWKFIKVLLGFWLLCLLLFCICIYMVVLRSSFVKVLEISYWWVFNGFIVLSVLFRWKRK